MTPKTENYFENKNAASQIAYTKIEQTLKAKPPDETTREDFKRAVSQALQGLDSFYGMPVSEVEDKVQKALGQSLDVQEHQAIHDADVQVDELPFPLREIATRYLGPKKIEQASEQETNPGNVISIDALAENRKSREGMAALLDTLSVQITKDTGAEKNIPVPFEQFAELLKQAEGDPKNTALFESIAMNASQIIESVQVAADSENKPTIAEWGILKKVVQRYWDEQQTKKAHTNIKNAFDAMNPDAYHY